MDNKFHPAPELFLNEMVRRIIEKQPSWGDMWKDCNEEFFMERIDARLQEIASSLKCELFKMNVFVDTQADIQKAAVDIANFAYMLWANSIAADKNHNYAAQMSLFPDVRGELVDLAGTH